MTINDGTQLNDLRNVDRMIDYSTGVANEFLARLNRIRSFVPEHNLTSGTANEMILRNFFAEFLNGQLAVGQGFICDPTLSDPSVSKQCDILVYDRNYPLVHSEGEVKVVWPQSVRLVIEVKTNLQNKRQIKDAVENISSAKNLPGMTTVPGIVFAFKSLQVETLVKHLQNHPIQFAAEHSPNAILLLEEGVILHRWTRFEEVGEDFYQVRKGREDAKAAVMAFLTMFFFDFAMGNKWGGSSIENMRKRLLEYRTDKIMEDFKIGERIDKANEV